MSEFSAPSTRLTTPADRDRFVRDARSLCQWFGSAGKGPDAAAQLAKRIKAELGNEMQSFLGWVPSQTIDPEVKYALIVREVEEHGGHSWSCPAMRS